MAQHDMVIDNGPGLAVRTDMNAAIQALATTNSGSVEPTVTYPGQLWLDTTVLPNGQLRMRNQANSGWINPVTGEPYVFGPADMSMLSRTTSGNLIAFNDKADGTGTDIASVSEAGSISGVDFNTSSGLLAGEGQLILSTGDTTGNIYLRPNGTGSVSGQMFIDGNGNVHTNAPVLSLIENDFYLTWSTGARALIWYTAGGTTSYGLTWQASNGDFGILSAGSYSLFIQASGNVLQIFGEAYKPGGGAWLNNSDARIKNVLGDYDSGLEQIKALQPVRYTYKGNDTAAEPHGAPIGQSSEYVPPDQAGTGSQPLPPPSPPEYGPATVPYFNSPNYKPALQGKEFIGLVAQDTETAMPELVSQIAGYIDGEAVTDLRTIDTTPLIFALINAVKQLAARVEALEGAGA